MALTKREERQIFYKLKKADDRQTLRFKSAFGPFRAADRIFEQFEENLRLKCPKCYGEDYIKHGQTDQDVQRYRCKDCQKTFTANRHLPFYRSNFSRDHWKAFCTSMLGGATLPELAEAYDINLKTAFRQCHKLLDALRELEKETWLAGRVWADEAYMHANRPGRGGGEQGHVTLLTGKDYKGKTFLKPVSPGRWTLTNQGP